MLSPLYQLRFLALAAVAASFASLVVASPAIAQETPADDSSQYRVDTKRDFPAEDRNQLTIGIGGGVGPSYDGSDNYRFIPGGLLQGRVSGFDFAVRGPGIGIDLVRGSQSDSVNIIAGPVIQARLERNGGIRDDRVRALGEIDVALEVGARLGVGKRGVFGGFDMLSAEATLVHDVTDVHDSYVISPSISYMTVVAPKTLAAISLSGTYVGGGYGRTYFDVSAAGSLASGLASYATGGSGFKDVGLSSLVLYQFGDVPRKGWGLFLIGSVKRLVGQYADSPIVADAGKREQSMFMLGVSYSF